MPVEVDRCYDVRIILFLVQLLILFFDNFRLDYLLTIVNFLSILPELRVNYPNLAGFLLADGD